MRGDDSGVKLELSPLPSSSPQHESQSLDFLPNQSDPAARQKSHEDAAAAAAAKAAAYETGWSDLSPSQITAVFFALSIGQLVVALDQSMIAVAMPNIVEQLGNPEMQSWLISGYILTNGCVYPLCGTFIDVYGRNAVFQAVSLALLTGSLLSGFADFVSPERGMLALVAARTITGIGAGGVFASSAIIIVDLVSPRERGFYQSIFNLARLVGTVGGPFVGGLICNSLHWRWIFFACVPICVVAMLVSHRILSSLQDVNTSGLTFWSLDFTGLFLLVAATLSLMLTVSWSGRVFGWDSVISISMLASSCVCYFLFVANELYRAQLPVLDMRLFANAAFSLGVMGFFLFGWAIQTPAPYLSTFFQLSQRLSPLQAGVRTIPLLGSTVLSALATSRYVAATGRNKGLPSLGMALVALGSMALALVLNFQRDSVWLLSMGMVVAGVGLGMANSTIPVIVTNTVEKSKAPNAQATAGFANRLGSSIGLAVFGAIYTAGLGAAPNASKQVAAVANGSYLVFVWMIFPCGLAAMVLFFMPVEELKTGQKVMSGDGQRRPSNSNDAANAHHDDHDDGRFPSTSTRQEALHDAVGVGVGAGIGSIGGAQRRLDSAVSLVQSNAKPNSNR